MWRRWFHTSHTLTVEALWNCGETPRAERRWRRLRAREGLHLIGCLWASLTPNDETPRICYHRRMKAALAVAAVMLAGIALSRYGTIPGQAEPYGYSTAEYPDDPAASVNRDLFQTDADTSGIKGGLRYADYDRERDGDWIDDFHGFGCLRNCHGHEAGYAWAEQQGISDPAECGGDSWPFEEGCAGYATEKG